MVNVDETQTEALPEVRCLRPRKQADRMQEETVTRISGDRRSRRRYPLDLQVIYKVVKNSRVCQAGAGKTFDLSGTGIAFHADDSLPPGSSVELSIAWPVLLNKTCPLQLVVTGKVVRSQRTLTAIRVQRYEFRTKGHAPLRTMAAGSTFFS